MSFAALALRARAANDTTRAQINNIPSKSHFIVLLLSIYAAKLKTALLKTRALRAANDSKRAVNAFTALQLIGLSDEY